MKKTSPSSATRWLHILSEHVDLSPLRSAKLWIVLGGSFVALSYAGYQLGDRNGLLIGFFLALGLNTLILFYPDWRLASLFPSTELEGQDPWGLLQTIRELSRAQGVPRPTLRMLTSETPVLFSAGLFRARTSFYLSTGLVQRLSREEVRAVLAYEIQRLKAQHVRSLTATSALASLLELVAGALDLGFRNGPFRRLITPIVGLFMRLGARPSDFYEMDLKTSETLGGKEPLARALIKLDAYNKTIPMDVNMAEANLFTVNPLARQRWCRLASVQPSVEARVKRLMGRFPL